MTNESVDERAESARDMEESFMSVVNRHNELTVCGPMLNPREVYRSMLAQIGDLNKKPASS